ncbi:hypothetical protein ACKKBG_A18565 [Auxenochlorella protothecoides x Auxenochlorella symbiontica]
MPPTVRNPTFLTGLVLLLTRCAFAATCSSTFVALPSAILGPHVYLTTVDSADAICKRKGFSKAGSVRTSTLSAVGLSMPAIRVRNLEILKSGATKILVAVECLKPGQKACTADGNGNIGSGNKGKNNFGAKNVGNNNIGNSNVGNANWGNNNEGNPHHRPRGRATIEFSNPVDGKVAVKVVLTTDGYVPYTITADLYSASFDNLLELTALGSISGSV